MKSNQTTHRSNLYLPDPRKMDPRTHRTFSTPQLIEQKAESSIYMNQSIQSLALSNFNPRDPRLFRNTHKSNNQPPNIPNNNVLPKYNSDSVEPPSSTSQNSQSHQSEYPKKPQHSPNEYPQNPHHNIPQQSQYPQKPDHHILNHNEYPKKPQHSPIEYPKKPQHSPVEYPKKPQHSPIEYPKKPQHSPVEYPKKPQHSPVEYPKKPQHSPVEYPKKPQHSPNEYPQNSHHHILNHNEYPKKPQFHQNEYPQNPHHNIPHHNEYPKKPQFPQNGYPQNPHNIPPHNEYPKKPQFLSHEYPQNPHHNIPHPNEYPQKPQCCPNEYPLKPQCCPTEYPQNPHHNIPQPNEYPKKPQFHPNEYPQTLHHSEYPQKPQCCPNEYPQIPPHNIPQHNKYPKKPQCCPNEYYQNPQPHQNEYPKKPQCHPNEYSQNPHPHEYLQNGQGIVNGPNGINLPYITQSSKSYYLEALQTSFPPNYTYPGYAFQNMPEFQEGSPNKGIDQPTEQPPCIIPFLTFPYNDKLKNGNSYQHESSSVEHTTAFQQLQLPLQPPTNSFDYGKFVNCNSGNSNIQYNDFDKEEGAADINEHFIHGKSYTGNDWSFKNNSSPSRITEAEAVINENNQKSDSGSKEESIHPRCNGKSRYITDEYHCRSPDRSRSRSRGRHRSGRSRSNSVSKSSSRLRQRSRTRSRTRSRSSSVPRLRQRSRSRSRSRSKLRLRPRIRQRSRSRSRQRSRSPNSIFRSRSRSRSLPRGRRSVDSASFSYKNRDRRGRRAGKISPEEAESLRRKLIEKWRMNNCETQDEMQKRLEEISEMNPDQILEEENKVWIRSAPADFYYERDSNDLKIMRATERLEKLCLKFRCELLDRGSNIRKSQTLKCPPPRKLKQRLCKHINQSSSSCSDSGSESDDSDVMNGIIEELERKQKHPYRLHPELWYNDPGEMNDGPLCRCSARARRSGIRHGFYAGEDQSAYCDPKTNNAGDLYYYRITISPPTNFLTRTPTIINHDDHEFIFEGFSLISHYPIERLPTCKVIRFNIEYIILYVQEKLPENFCIEEVDLFYNYLFKEILELVDFDLTNLKQPNSCPHFHFMPRFVRELPDNGRELLPMCEVLKYLLQSNKKLIEDEALEIIHGMSNNEWLSFADSVKGMVVTNPGMKPCSLRVDQLDRDTDEFRNRNKRRDEDDYIRNEKKDENAYKKRHKDDYHRNNRIDENGYNKQNEKDCNREKKDEDDCHRDKKKDEDDCNSFNKSINEPTSFEQDSKDILTETCERPKLEISSEEESKNDAKGARKFYPEIVHFGIRPPQLSYAGNPEYQKAWRNYVKFRHLLANMPKPTAEDKQKLSVKENCLNNMRAQSKMKRDVTVTVSSKGFYLTGLMCDVVQHAMLIPVLVCHLRFHRSLAVLEKNIGYKFKNRSLLQLALTHPSYRENFGTNPDHARNSLTNCGIRQPKYGDRRIHYMNTRKRGINTLISIMSRFGKKNETESNIYHNERLEFLGDAVVELITSIHLFHIFRDLEEGGLATYRAALVQNQHLSVLAKKLNLDAFMLYAHGSDLCHDIELKHAMANCFEALMGALFLDGGLEAADHVFGRTLYGDDEDCLDIWCNYAPHPLQEQEPLGDRKWIQEFPLLQKLTEFEESTGIEFKHIRLLARAFTDRSVGYTNLTMGSNQRLEFLGDSVLQLIASEYLYKYFPEHHEGHLSLLRSSLVNNKTQSVVCDDLGMTKYAVYANPKVELKVKDRADLLEAFLGALYIDSGLEVCRVFCGVCFFPRLQVFIMNQDWNDPKSKLQQCCLTLRTMDKVEPDIPVYKVVECKGPTNTRVYTVAVYFRNKRLAEATGHSIQQAEMNAAQKAMEVSGPLFPQLDHQKRVIAKSLKTQKWPNLNPCSLETGCNAVVKEEDSVRETKSS